MIWMCSVLTANDHIDAIPTISRTLNVVDAAIKATSDKDEQEIESVVDGRLTRLERVPEVARPHVLSELQRLDLYDTAFPEGFAHALSLYPTAPGRWLLQAWFDRGLVPDPEQAQAFLGPVIVKSIDTRGEVATRAKAIAVGRHFKAGTFTANKGALPFDLMARYPFGLSEEDLKRVDSLSRALFMSLASQEWEEGEQSRSLQWARTFWRENWKIYPCLGDDEERIEHENPEDPIDLVGSAHLARVEALHEAFLEVALRADPDLFEPDRYEVVTGIVARAIHLGAAAASTPILWSGTHGSPIVRSLVESLIILRWLLKRNDPALYTKFKDYGRGRLKLLKLHLEELIDTLDDPSAELEEYLKYLDGEVNSEIHEEFQNISIESTFSGVSARTMATEVGMEREYRLLFAPASSETHGEWSSLDRHILVRCRNSLHGGHRVPITAFATPIGAYVIASIADLAELLVGEYIAVFDVDDIPKNLAEGR